MGIHHIQYCIILQIQLIGHIVDIVELVHLHQFAMVMVNLLLLPIHLLVYILMMVLPGKIVILIHISIYVMVMANLQQLMVQNLLTLLMVSIGLNRLLILIIQNVFAMAMESMLHYIVIAIMHTILQMGFLGLMWISLILEKCQMICIGLLVVMEMINSQQLL